MQPLPTIAAPTHGVLLELTPDNSWPNQRARARLAFVATNSTASLSFVSLQAATHPEHVTRLASRPASDPELQEGVVVEVYLAQDLLPGDTVWIHLAQSGATIYFPPQPIDG